jgi:hypothetical protein
VKLLLDILQGAGFATATGLRPFLPALAAGGLAAADLGVDFEGTEFAFLEDPWFLMALAVAAVVVFLGRAYFERGLGEAVLAGAGTILGALLCAASIDDRHGTWWYGLALGAALSLLSASVSRDLVGRVRERFVAQGDRQAAAALPVYLDGVGLIVVGLSVLFPPFALAAVIFLVVLGVRSRGGTRRFAGLRTLRGD